MSGANARLIATRDQANWARLRKLRIILDRKEVGRVKSELLEFYCEEGDEFEVMCLSPNFASSWWEIVKTSIWKKTSAPFEVSIIKRGDLRECLRGC